MGAAAQALGLRGATIANGLACTAMAAWILHRRRDSG
jgi:hypothetical protein